MRLLESTTSSLVRALSTQGANFSRRESFDTNAGPEAAGAVPPVIQATPIAMPLDPATYRNPRGPTNPNGSLLPLFAFRALVDPVPTFTRYYGASAVTTEGTYDNLLQGANASSTFVQQVLGNAKQQFAAAAFPSLDGTPSGPWRPVYATPANWFDIDASQYQPLSVTDSLGGDGFTVLGDASDAAPSSPPNAIVQSAGTDPATRILSASLRYLVVDVTRPWLDFSLFGLGGWALDGAPIGYYSSGNAASNGGLMPLLPTSIVLGTQARISAVLGPADRAVLRDAARQGRPVSFGAIPLAVDAAALEDTAGAAVTLTSPMPFIVAWISALVPLAPSGARSPTSA